MVLRGVSLPAPKCKEGIEVLPFIGESVVNGHVNRSTHPGVEAVPLALVLKLTSSANPIYTGNISFLSPS